MKGFVLRLGILCLAAGIGGTAAAAPGTIAYDGILTGENGLPYNGDVTVTVELFDAMMDGNSLYLEDLGTAAAFEGELGLVLGDDGNAALADVFAMTDGIWAEFTVDGEVLVPRQRIRSVPFALVAQSAQSVGGLPADQVASKDEVGSFTLGKDQLPFDGLSTIANGTLSNEYVDQLVDWEDGPIDILDNDAGGATALVTTPEVAGAVLGEVLIDFTYSVSIVSQLTFTLEAPNGETFVLFSGLQVPGDFTVTVTPEDFPSLDSLIGSDPSGAWTLTGVDSDFTGPIPSTFATLNSFSLLYNVIRPNAVLATADVDVAGDLSVQGEITGVGAVPAGAVMFFDLAECPAGWSPMNSAHGRVLVGVPSVGTVGTQVGTPLTDGGARVITEVPKHAHTVDPPAATTSTDGAHSHTIGAGGADDNNHTGNGDFVADSDASPVQANRSTSTNGAHNHTLDIGAFDSAETGADTVDVTMPYLQLLVCKKD